jgi:hypothetical protein
MTRVALLPTISLAALLLAATPRATAGTPAGGGEQGAVVTGHELALALGTLPVTSEGRGLTLFGGYIYHFTERIAWEALAGIWFFNFQDPPNQELKDRFDVQTTGDQNELDQILCSNFVIKPLHGRFSLFDGWRSRAEVHLVIGVALGWYTPTDPLKDTFTASGFDVGLGLRMFLGRHTSLRLDIREYLLFHPGFSEVGDSLYVALGLAFTFGQLP